MPKEILYSKKQGEENKYKYPIFYTPPASVPEKIVPVEDLGMEGNEDAYASANWARSLYKYVDDLNTGVRTYSSADYTTRCWRGYKDETGLSAVPYLLPLSTTTVGASKYLDNKGYGLE